MTFGQTVKKLRLEASLTQERMAELLSISPQAVSRWECDAAMPDISLIVPIANLFGVTTDLLLGMDEYQRDLKKAEYDAAFFEYWKRDDKWKNYEIAVRAAADYPGNMEYLEWLASAEYYVAFSEQEEEYRRLLESSVVHYGVVIKNTRDVKLLDKARFGIALSLSELGRKGEARGYADVIEDRESRDTALGFCLEGEEKRRHCQAVAERHLFDFISSFRYACGGVLACEAVEAVLAVLFPDGNYQYYHNTLQYNSVNKAFALVNSGRYDGAVAALKSARYHAGEMAKYGRAAEFRFTGPFFDLVSGEKPVSDAVEDDVDDFRRCLDNNRCFDVIREREEFQELYK